MSNFKHDLFAQFAQIGKALSNSNRLELLEYLAQGERSVDDLAKVSGLSVANTSQHLQLLKQTNLVKVRKSGLKSFYQLSGKDVVDLLSILRHVAENRSAEVQRLIDTYLKSKDSLESLTREELLTRVREDSVVVLDVRPIEEYKAGHVPGAINIMLSELESYLETADTSREIVAYCRGPHCILSFDAVEKLRQHGIKASRLEDGFPEWQAAGLPTENTKSVKNGF